MYQPRRDERLSWPGWLTYSGRFTHKWSPISCRSSAGQGKFAGQRPTFYHCATQPTYQHIHKHSRDKLSERSAWRHYPAGFVSLVDLFRRNAVLHEFVQPLVVAVDARVEHRQLTVVVVVGELRVDARLVVWTTAESAAAGRRHGRGSDRRAARRRPPRRVRLRPPTTGHGWPSAGRRDVPADRLAPVTRRCGPAQRCVRYRLVDDLRQRVFVGRIEVCLAERWLFSAPPPPTSLLLLLLLLSRQLVDNRSARYINHWLYGTSEFDALFHWWPAPWQWGVEICHLRLCVCLFLHKISQQPMQQHIFNGGTVMSIELRHHTKFRGKEKKGRFFSIFHQPYLWNGWSSRAQ